MLVVAGRNDPIIGVDEAEEIVAALPPGIGSLEVVAGAGHTPFRDQPEAYFTAVEAFARSAQLRAASPGSRREGSRAVARIPAVRARCTQAQ